MSASYDELMDIAKECLKVAVRSGAPKVSAYIKVVYRPDGDILTIEQKTFNTNSWLNGLRAFRG